MKGKLTIKWKVTQDDGLWFTSFDVSEPSGESCSSSSGYSTKEEALRAMLDDVLDEVEDIIYPQPLPACYKKPKEVR